jgi:uncharacterized protein (DUF433 family)
MDIQEVITTDKDVLGGQAVFTGTRVPIQTLFDHLEAGVSLEEFLDDFPTVTREQAISLLDKKNLESFLLKGPVFSDNQIKEILKSRKAINNWRRK